MEYNTNYKNPNYEKAITKKELNEMTWRSLILQASFNYERMQAGGWLYSLIPGLRKIHKNKEDLSMAMKEHMQFFNTHPFLVTFMQGVIISMEENKLPRDSINGIKVALMGPLGGIGDALFWLTLLPIAGGIGASMSIAGNPFGPIFFLIAFNIVHFFLRFGLMRYGYNTGTNAMNTLKENTRRISRAATILGLTVVGALSASFVNFTLPIVIETPQISFNLQTAMFDTVMPKLLPLLYTFLCYVLLKKEVSPILIILFTLLIGLVGAGLGIYV